MPYGSGSRQGYAAVTARLELLARLVLSPLTRLVVLLLMLGRPSAPSSELRTVRIIPTRPTGPTQRGRRMPRTRSRENASGSRIMRAVEIAMLRTGSSAPPSVTQIGLPQCAFLVAMQRKGYRDTPRVTTILTTP
jgi:hypothetical protein